MHWMHWTIRKRNSMNTLIKRTVSSDMSRYIKENSITVHTNFGYYMEVWFVTPHRLFSRENQILNEQLGIN